MSGAPSVTVTSGSSAPSSSPPIDTGTWFVTGIAEKGPHDVATLVLSKAQAESVYGGRANGQTLIDSLEAFFKEGGARAYVGRVVGPSPVLATVNLSDGSNNTLTANATSYGAWANGLQIITSHPGETTFKFVLKLGGVVVQESPTFTTNTEAVSWASTSPYIRLVDLGHGIPAAATKELASGTDDHGSATETTWNNALNLFTADLGPGQVSAAGRTTAEAQTNVLAHCAAKNRIALLDGTDTATVATLTSQAATLRALSNARFGGLFAPWAVIPGTAPGTTRTIPPSAVQAGLTARSDGLTGNPNLAIAGTGEGRGVARYATGLSQAAWSASDRGTLAEAGVNVIRQINGSVTTYDDITLINPLVDTTWLELSNARCNMAIQSRSFTVGQRHLFAQIDGKGVEIAKFGGDLTGEVLLPLYDLGALYGETPEDAFTVETGSQVNTEKSIGEGKLNAALLVSFSESARNIEINISVEAI